MIHRHQLYEHQKTALRYARKVDHPALFMEMRLGKTLVVIRRAKMYVPRDRARGLRVLVAGPTSALGAWEEELKRESQSFLLLLGAKEKREKSMNAFAPYTGKPLWFLMNKEGWTVLPTIGALPWDVVVVDECFAKGTQVDTPEGAKSIENIKTGDVVRNANGVGRVRAVRMKLVEEIAVVVVEGRKIVCSVHHPFFTKRGWICAKELRDGDKIVRQEEAVCMVQEVVHPEEDQQRSFLRNILFREMEDDDSGSACESIRSRRTCALREENGEMVENGGRRSTQSKAGQNQQTEREKRSVSCKCVKRIEGCRSHAEEERRERGGANKSTVEIVLCSWDRVDDGVLHPCFAEDARHTAILLDRHSRSKVYACRRGGRAISQSVCSTRSRQNKGSGITGQRVDSVAIYKRGDPEYASECGTDRSVLLYDLEIEGHPSFSVNGLLVHNSHFIKNATAYVTKWFASNFRSVPHRWILTGTPNAEGAHEYFTQMQFLRGGFMGHGTFWTWRQEYMHPSAYGGGWFVKPKRTKDISNAVAEAALVMRRKDVHLQEQKVRESRTLDLPPEIRKVYDKAESSFVLEYKETETERSTKWSTVRWQWLRQICGGFIDKKLAWSGKIDALVELLNGELLRERVVVWCSYNQEITAICTACWKAKPRIEAAAITGEMKPKDRETMRKKFFSIIGPRVLVVQQAVAPSGMNLSAADTAIYYSEPVGLTARKQTEDRILTVEKVKRKVPLLYVNMYVKDSVDSDVRAAMCEKRLTSDAQLSQVLRASMERRINESVPD